MAIPYNAAIPLNPLHDRAERGKPRDQVAPASEAPLANDDAPEVITARQIRAGRALLGWSQGQLAKAAKVGPATVARIELGTIDPKASSLKAIAKALKDEGVRLLDADDTQGEGARMAKPDE